MKAIPKYFKNKIEVKDPEQADSVLHYHDTYYIESVETGAQYAMALDPYPLDPPRTYTVTNVVKPTQSVEVAPLPDPNTLDGAKYYKEQEIEIWNASSAINEFYLNGAPFPKWLGTTERSEFFNTLTGAKMLLDAGKSTDDTVTLGVPGLTVQLPITLGFILAAQLQDYASKTEVIKVEHIAAMNALATIEEVQAYDYKTGYPEKPEFTL